MAEPATKDAPEADTQKPNDDKAEFPNENLMFAGGDVIEDEDLSTYDPELGLVANPTEETAEETTDEADEAPEEETTDEVEPVEETEEVSVEEDTPAEAEAEETTDDAVGEAPEAESEPAEEKTSDKGIQIPKWRLDQQTARLRAAEKELETLRAKDAVSNAPPPVVELPVEKLEELERKYSDFVLDGKTEEASKVRTEINSVIQEATLATVMRSVDKQVSDKVFQQAATSDLDKVITQLETDYEFLRQGSDTFDEDLLEEIGTFYSGYSSRGFTPAEAMAKAADNALKLYKPELFDAKPAEDDAPNLRNVTDKKEQRKKEIKRNVDAATKQPPELPDTDSKSPEDGIDVMQLSDEELDALPEAVKRRLRGDFVKS